MSSTNQYYVDYQPFECTDIASYPEPIFDTACEKAEMFLQFQGQNLSEIDQKCMTILGWLFAAISGLIGYIAVFFSGIPEQQNWKLFAIALLALVVFSISAAILFKSNLYKRASYGTGVGPDIFFNKDIREWVEKNYPETEHSKMIKGCYLDRLQDHIIYNSKEITHRVKHYRASLWVITIGLMTLFLASITLAFF